MEQVGTMLLIFCLRLCDVSLGTIRSLYVVRGDRRWAVPLAFGESLIWIIAISKIMTEVNAGHTYNMIAYAGGFAAGTLSGMTIERWIASGWVLVQVFTQTADLVAAALRERHFGVTQVQGTGRQGEQAMLFIVARRRRGNELLELVRSLDDDAFVTIDAVNTAQGGYLPAAARVAASKDPTAMRK